MRPTQPTEPTRPGGPRLPSRLRLQSVLLLVIAWDAAAIVAEVSYGGPLFKVAENGEVSGLIGARGAFGGAAVVPLVLYVYALLRGPLRYRGLLWVGVLEQSVVAVFSVYHLAVGDLRTASAVAPIAISLVLVLLLLVNMPRGAQSS